MTTTLPGGFWYPERDTILNAGGVGEVTVLPGDAVGAQFSWNAPLACDGTAFGMRYGSTSDFQIDLTTADGTILHSTAWPGTRNPQPPHILWVTTVLWESITLSSGVTYRVVCTATGAAALTVGDAPAPGEPLAIALGLPPTTLGYRVSRVSGVWTEYPTRRLNAAIHVGGL